MIMGVVLCCASLAAGNFLWQLFTKRDYAEAYTRSYFQTMAVVIYALLWNCAMFK